MSGLEVIGSVASVLQLASTVYSISKTLYEVGDALSNAPSDIKDLARDLETFSEELHLLSSLLNDKTHRYSDRVYRLTAKIIGDCASICVKIDKILRKLRSGSFLARVKWVFKEKEIMKLLVRLRDLKLSLMGTLSLLSALKADHMMDAMGVPSTSLLDGPKDERLSKETEKEVEETRRKLAGISAEQKSESSLSEDMSGKTLTASTSHASSGNSNSLDSFEKELGLPAASRSLSSSTTPSASANKNPVKEVPRGLENPTASFFISTVALPKPNTLARLPQAMESVQSFYSAFSRHDMEEHEDSPDANVKSPQRSNIMSNEVSELPGSIATCPTTSGEDENWPLHQTAQPTAKDNLRSLDESDILLNEWRADMTHLAMKRFNMNKDAAEFWALSLPAPDISLFQGRAEGNEERPLSSAGQSELGVPLSEDLRSSISSYDFVNESREGDDEDLDLDGEYLSQLLQYMEAQQPDIPNDSNIRRSSSVAQLQSGLDVNIDLGDQQLGIHQKISLGADYRGRPRLSGLLDESDEDMGIAFYFPRRRQREPQSDKEQEAKLLYSWEELRRRKRSSDATLSKRTAAQSIKTGTDDDYTEPRLPSPPTDSLPCFRGSPATSSAIEGHIPDAADIYPLEHYVAKEDSAPYYRETVQRDALPGQWISDEESSHGSEDIARRKRPRASRPKVKTGCNNCKTSRVKCDEARFQCQNCVKSGTQCAGYPAYNRGMNVPISPNKKPAVGMPDMSNRIGGTGGNFGGIDFSKLGGAGIKGAGEEDQEDEDMPELEEDDKPEPSKTKIEEVAIAPKDTVLAAAGAVGLAVKHREETEQGSPSRNVTGGAALGAIGTEIFTRARSRYREDSSQARSRPSSRDSNAKIKSALGLGVAGVAAAATIKYAQNRADAAEGTGRGRSRTRSTSRRRTSAVRYSYREHYEYSSDSSSYNSHKLHSTIPRTNRTVRRYRLQSGPVDESKEDRNQRLVVYERDQKVVREHTPYRERPVNGSWESDGYGSDINVRIGKLAERREYPYELERSRRDIEYYDHSKATTQPVITRQRAPESNRILVGSPRFRSRSRSGPPSNARNSSSDWDDTDISSRVQSLSSANDAKHRAVQMAKAGAATTAVAGVVEHFRDKSRTRSRSRERSRSGLKIGGAGLAGAAVAGIYENRETKSAQNKPRYRTRSRNRSRARSTGSYSDPGVDPDLGMVHYGAELLYADNNQKPMEQGDTTHSSNDTGYDKSFSAILSSTRDVRLNDLVREETLGRLPLPGETKKTEWIFANTKKEENDGFAKPLIDRLERSRETMGGKALGKSVEYVNDEIIRRNLVQSQTDLTHLAQDAYIHRQTSNRAQRSTATSKANRQSIQISVSGNQQTVTGDGDSAAHNGEWVDLNTPSAEGAGAETGQEPSMTTNPSEVSAATLAASGTETFHPVAGTKYRSLRLACDRCRRRKLGCDKSEPCGNCAKRNEPFPCTYDYAQNQQSLLNSLKRRRAGSSAKSRSVASQNSGKPSLQLSRSSYQQIQDTANTDLIDKSGSISHQESADDKSNPSLPVISRQSVPSVRSRSVQAVFKYADSTPTSDRSEDEYAEDYCDLEATAGLEAMRIAEEDANTKGALGFGKQEGSPSSRHHQAQDESSDSDYEHVDLELVGGGYDAHMSYGDDIGGMNTGHSSEMDDQSRPPRISSADPYHGPLGRVSSRVTTNLTSDTNPAEQKISSTVVYSSFYPKEQISDLWWRAFQQLQACDHERSGNLAKAWVAAHDLASYTLSSGGAMDSIAHMAAERFESIFSEAQNQLSKSSNKDSGSTTRIIDRYREILKVMQETLDFKPGALVWTCLCTLARELLEGRSYDEILRYHKALENLSEIATLVARYNVLESIYQQWPGMSLEPNYENSLIALCVHVLRYLDFALCAGLDCNRQLFEADLDALMMKINEADVDCRGFSVTIVSANDGSEDMRREVEDVSTEENDSDSTEVGEKVHDGLVDRAPLPSLVKGS